MTTSLCPLCGETPAEFHSEIGRHYWRCPTCALVFLDPSQRIAFDDEVARYALHDNRMGDPEYERFLARLAEPIIARTPVGARGIDFGCGQAPALGDMLTRSGRPTASYDPHFFPNDELLDVRYDFLTCSEVLEHVHEPLPLLDRFAALVRRGGIIGVMTGPYDTAGPFQDWWYRRDPTHVCFYAADTMTWIARRFGWALERPSSTVTVFSQSVSTSRP